mgnify:CR=1 FL=1
MTPLSLTDTHTLLEQNTLFLDLRSKEEFASLHIARSINIPYTSTCGGWIEALIPKEHPVVLLLPAISFQGILEALSKRGFTILGFFVADSIALGEWKTSGFPTDHIVTTSIKEIYCQIQENHPPLLIDVRTKEEWDNGHIESAHHFPLGDSPLPTFPHTTALALFCASGYRSAVASSLLKRAGYHTVANVTGGMNAWNDAGFPTIPRFGY